MISMIMITVRIVVAVHSQMFSSRHLPECPCFDQALLAPKPILGQRVPTSISAALASAWKVYLSRVVGCIFFGLFSFRLASILAWCYGPRVCKGWEEVSCGGAYPCELDSWMHWFGCVSGPVRSSSPRFGFPSTEISQPSHAVLGPFGLCLLELCERTHANQHSPVRSGV